MVTTPSSNAGRRAGRSPRSRRSVTALAGGTGSEPGSSSSVGGNDENVAHGTNQSAVGAGSDAWMASDGGGVGELERLELASADDSEESGEDLLEDMERDYQPNPELDRYETDSEAELDPDADERMDAAARRAADREVDRRRRRELRRHRRQSRMARMLWSDADDGTVASSQRMSSGGVSRQRAPPFSPSGAESYGATPSSPISTGILNVEGYSSADPTAAARTLFDDATADAAFNLEEFSGDLRSWIRAERPRRALQRRFANFLRQAVDDTTGRAIYVERMRQMCARNGQSLIVSYQDMMRFDPLLAVWVTDAPTEMLRIFDDTALLVTLALYPAYKSIQREVHVRIADLPIRDALRDIRQVHLNCLIKVSGVVTKRGSVLPQLRVVKLNCQRCGALLEPNVTNAAHPEHSVRHCSQCDSRGPFTINSAQTMYGNYQKMVVQEPPGTVPPGRLPRYKEVVCTADLVDVARPGDLVEVTGIYRHNFDASLNLRNGFPIFSTGILANYVRKLEDAQADVELTEDDEQAIRRLAAEPRIGERLVASIAPSIYGHTNIKRALALALFGGEAKEIGEKHRTRGDINVLLLGDPGMAKSQFLKYVEKTAHRAVYTTGKGASAVGLTAAVQRDPVTREWTLEGGALVLADRGTCLIDEFDKMNDQDRTSIHEAMEQQSISISKAGIVTTLQARCSVIAAANPLRGRYDPSVSFMENVDLTEPILSRFDVLCVIRDVVDVAADEALAAFVVRSHIASHPHGTEGEQEEEEQEMGAEAASDPVPTTAQSSGDAVLAPDGGPVRPIPQPLLRKYLLYARRHVHPRLTHLDEHKLAQLYIDLRRESLACGGMPIALRHLESIVRLAEAHARMHLHDTVRDADVNAAIAVMLESFFSSQKYSVMRGLKRTFYKYLAYQRNDHELLLHLLNGMVREYAAAAAAAAAPTTATRTPSQPSGSPSERPAPTVAVVDRDDFENRAAQMGIESVAAFYGSDLFTARRFRLDAQHNAIIQTL
ncbi:hypothetical protein CDCA_CDCA03G1083 [Cyanidium caldarium]|uniref:DNA replication licensing factor MCM2 n=1 Tax=Cyanidium caldarium TaxID=2771 RepID=A0AAV9ISK8_CYACA|nr:hypothetical protein CDCA_CDCA03G1083 [Cyanidium caldarium]